MSCSISLTGKNQEKLVLLFLFTAIKVCPKTLLSFVFSLRARSLLGQPRKAYR